MESILKGRASQNDFNSYSKGETMKVTLILEQPSYTVKALYTDIRYNDKIRYHDNFNGTIP